MSKITVYSGSAGVGKTYTAIQKFTEAVSSGNPLFPEYHCFFVAPEQFCVDIEKKILENCRGRGFVDSEVIPFNRLLYKVLTDNGTRAEKPVNSAVASMLLTNVLYRNQNKFTYFSGIAEKPGAVSKLYSAISELQKYSVSPELLRQAAALSEEKSRENRVTPAKLRDFADVLELYRDAIPQGFTDQAKLTEDAVRLIYEGKTALSDSIVIVDSFSGFTENEMNVLKAISVVCRELHIFLFRGPSDSCFFRAPNDTYRRVIRTLRTQNQEWEEVDLDRLSEESGNSRYAHSPALGYLARSFGDYRMVGYDGPADEVELVQAADFYREMETAADRILEYVAEGYRFSDIALILPEIDKKHFLAEAVLGNRNVPFFLDTRLELSGHPAIRFADCFLRLIGGGDCGQTLIGLLKTGLFRRSRFSQETVDLLENKMLKYSVSRKNQLETLRERLKKEAAASPENTDLSDLAELCGDLYRTFYGAEGFCERAKAASCVKDCLNLLSDFFRETGVTDSLRRAYDEMLGNGTGEGEDPQFVRVWNVFSDICGECAEILGDVKLQGYRKRFLFTDSLLMAGVSSYKAGFLPLSGNTLHVGDMERSKYIDKKIIMILGANEGNFPAPCEDAGFLRDGEREAIREAGARIAYDSSDRTLLSQYNVYTCMMTASSGLYLSYSAADGEGKPLEACNAVHTIGKLLPSLAVSRAALVPEEGPAALSEEVSLTPALVKELLHVKAQYRTSVSSLEKYAECPFAFLESEVLRLKERDRGNLAANYLGSYFHGILEKAVPEALKLQNSGNPVTRDQWKQLVDQASREYLEDERNSDLLYEKNTFQRSRVLLDRIDGFAVFDLDRMERLSRSTGFRPFQQEISYGEGKKIPAVVIPFGNLEGILSGKIDRIDEKKSGDTRLLSIVDYKTGSSDVDLGEVLSGRNIQLATYLLALDNAKTGGEQIHSLSYYLLGNNSVAHDRQSSKLYHTYSAVVNGDAVGDGQSDPYCTELKNTVNTVSFHDLAEQNKQTLGTLMENITGGCFDVRPEAGKTPSDRNGPCKYCPYVTICNHKNQEGNTK